MSALVTSASRFIRLVHAERLRSGIDIRAAVRRVISRSPELEWRVLEEIGCWPSSEPELRELQRMGGVS